MLTFAAPLRSALVKPSVGIACASRPYEQHQIDAWSIGDEGTKRFYVD